MALGILEIIIVVGLLLAALAWWGQHLKLSPEIRRWKPEMVGGSLVIVLLLSYFTVMAKGHDLGIFLLAWGGLLTVVLLAALAWWIQHLSPQTRRWGAGILAGGLATVLLLFPFVGFYSTRRIVQAPSIPSHPQTKPADHAFLGNIPVHERYYQEGETQGIYRELTPREAAQLAKPTSNPSPQPRSTPSTSVAKATAEATAAEATTEETKTEETKPVADNSSKPTGLPAWTTEPPRRNGDVYFEVVRSGIVSDPHIREAKLEAKMVLTAERYIDQWFNDQPGVAEIAKIDARYLREHCLAGELYQHTYPDGNNESFVWLRLDNQFRHEVNRRYQQYVSTRRAEQLGAVALGTLGIIAAALGFLKFTKPRETSL